MLTLRDALTGPEEQKATAVTAATGTAAETGEGPEAGWGGEGAGLVERAMAAMSAALDRVDTGNETDVEVRAAPGRSIPEVTCRYVTCHTDICQVT